MTTDEELVVGARSGDRVALATLVRRYHGSLMRIARAYVGNRQSAEDVAQEAWLGVLRGLPRFEGRASFRTWVFSILVNRAKTRGTRDRRMVPLVLLPDGEAGDDQPGGGDAFSIPAADGSSHRTTGEKRRRKGPC